MTLRYALLISVLLAATACNNDGEPQQPDKGLLGKPLSFFCENIEEINGDSVSRTTTQLTEFEDGDAIGIFAFNQIKGEVNWSHAIAENVKYTYDAASGLFKFADRQITYQGAPMQFLVYYPYSSAVTDYRQLAHTVQGQADANGWKQADLLYCSYFNTSQSLDIPLTFRHQHAMIEVSITKNDGIAGIDVENIYTPSTTDLKTGNVTPGTTRQTLSMYKFAESGTTASYRLILPVQGFANTEHKFIVKNNDGSTVGMYSSANIPLYQGKISTIDLVYRKSVQIDDYAPGGTTTGADLYRVMENCTVKATPKSGYTFLGWIKDGGTTYVSTEPSYTFTVTDDVTLAPHYRHYGDWTVTVNADPALISKDGGSATLTAAGKRDILDNGTASGTDTQAIGTFTSDNDNFTVDDNKVTVGANPTTDKRSATISAAIGTATGSVTVEQEEGVPVYSYTAWKTVSLDVAATPGTVKAAGSEEDRTSTFSVTANQKRQKITTVGGVESKREDETQQVAIANDHVSWSKVSGEGSVTAQGKAVFDENTTTNARLGAFQGDYEGGSGSVTVYQAAGTVSYSYSLTFSDGDTYKPAVIAADATSLTYTVSSTYTKSVNGKDVGTYAQDWSVASDADWATVTTNGNDITVAITENNTTASRSGTVTVTQDTTRKTISVSIRQARKINVDIGN